MTDRSLGLRLLCVRLTLAEAISELQELAMQFPDNRTELLGMESKVRWLRDDLFSPPAPPPDTQANEDNLDFLFPDHTKEKVA